MLFKMDDAALFFSPIVVFLLVGWLLGRAFFVMSILWFIVALFHGSFQVALCYQVCMETFTGMKGWLPELTGLIMFSLEALKLFVIDKKL